MRAPAQATSAACCASSALLTSADVQVHHGGEAARRMAQQHPSSCVTKAVSASADACAAQVKFYDIEDYNPGSAASQAPKHTSVIDKCGTATAAQAASQ